MDTENEGDVAIAEMELKHLPFEMKDLQADGSFTGYGAYFGNMDYVKDICQKGCFAQSILDHEKAGTMPSMYAYHDKSLSVGDWLEWKEDSRGLLMRGQFWIGKGIQESERCYMMAKSKMAKGLSIGYIARKALFDEKKGTRTLIQCEVREVSVTPVPVNPKAVFTAVKSLQNGSQVITVRKAEEILRDVGWSAQDAKTFLSGLKMGFKAETQRDADILAELKSEIDTTLSIIRNG